MLILEMWEAGSGGEYNQDTLYTLLNFQRINIFKKRSVGNKKIFRLEAAISGNSENIGSVFIFVSTHLT